MFKKKSEIPYLLGGLLRQIQKEFGFKVKFIHSDRGTEFVNSTLRKYFNEAGIKFNSTTPGIPQRNGTAERANQLVEDIIRSCLFSA